MDSNCSNNNLQEQMKMDLKSCGFAILELALYLDTHPDDMRAICLHNEECKRYRKISDEYQKIYGPLTIGYPCNSWRWLEEPWPWQTTNNCPGNRNEDENRDYDLKGGIK